MGMEPKEILTSPFEAYLADAGTAFPALDEEPGVDWELVGKNGSRSMEEAGVTVEMPQTTNDVFVAGATGPVKKTRTQETLSIAFTLYDMRPAAMTHVINGRAVTDNPPNTPGSGDVGNQSIGLMRGTGMKEYALLLRGNTASPELLDQPAQYEVPRVVQVGSPTIVHQKGVPAGLAFQFDAMIDLDAEEEFQFGRFRVMDALGS